MLSGLFSLKNLFIIMLILVSANMVSNNLFKNRNNKPKVGNGEGTEEETEKFELLNKNIIEKFDKYLERIDKTVVSLEAVEKALTNKVHNKSDISDDTTKKEVDMPRNSNEDVPNNKNIVTSEGPNEVNNENISEGSDTENFSNYTMGHSSSYGGDYLLLN